MRVTWLQGKFFSQRATIKKPLVAAIALITLSCGEKQAPRIGMTAPNPDGCYVQVYEGERFVGQSDFINGPNRYRTLEHFPNGANWSKRIRALKVGPAATVVLWSDADFQGQSLKIGVDRSYSALIDALTGEVESMEVACVAQPGEVSKR